MVVLSLPHKVGMAEGVVGAPLSVGWEETTERTAKRTARVSARNIVRIGRGTQRVVNGSISDFIYIDVVTH